MRKTDRETSIEKAHRIHRLLQRDGVRERFRAQCQTFYDKLTAWEQADEAREAALKPFRKKLDRITFKKIKCAKRMGEVLKKRLLKTSPEYKRLEVIDERLTKQKHNAQDELEKAEANLQEPGQYPTDWLEAPRGYLRDRRMRDHFFPPDGPGATEEIERLRAYVLATIVHDKALGGPGYQCIAEGIWEADELFAENQWDKMTGDPCPELGCGWAVWCDQIETAIRTIRCDLKNTGYLRVKEVPSEPAKPSAKGVEASGQAGEAGKDKEEPSEVAETLSPALSKPPENPAENIFRKNGDTWTLGYDGKTVTGITDSKGLTQIAYLLARPHKEINCIELSHVPNAPSRSAAASSTGKEDEEDTREASGSLGKRGAISYEGCDTHIDREYVASIMNRLRELNSELARAKDNNDEAEQTRVQNDIDDIQAALQAATGIRGRARKFLDDHEKARTAVKKTIDRAIRHIRQNHPSFADHLTHIHTGLTCSYRPDQEVPWQF